MDGWLQPTVSHYVKMEDVIQPCLLEENAWWKSLKLFGTPLGRYTNKFADAMHNFFMEKSQGQHVQDILPQPTIKSCPGLIDLFKRTYVIKWPHDVVVHTYEDGRYESHAPDENPAVHLAGHDQWQRSSNSHTVMNGYINIKFNTPILLKASEVTRWTFSIPAYHTEKHIPYVVTPGVLTLYKNRYEHCNINVMFEQKDATYYFKCGDPIAYLTSTGVSSVSPIKTIQDDIYKLPGQVPGRKTFSGDTFKMRKSEIHE